MVRQQQRSVALFRSWGEPWIFGVPDPDGQDFFRELGFDPGKPLAVSNMELIRRYAMNAQGKIYGAPIFEKLRAQRPEGQSNSRPETYWLTELTVLKHKMEPAG